MSAPPIPDNVVSGLGVRGAGRGYFSRSIPFSKGGGVPGPYPAPPGYRWQPVYYGANPVFYGTERVYTLERAA